MPSISKAIVIVWLALLPPPALAQAMAPALTPAPAQPAVTPAEAQRALDILQDPAKRAQLIETLQTIAKAAPGPAQPTLAPGSIGAQLLAQSSRWADRLAGSVATAVASMTAFPRMLRGLRQMLSDPAGLAGLAESVWGAALALFLALLLEQLLRRGLRRPLGSIAAHAPDREPEPVAGDPDRPPDAAAVSPAGLRDAQAERHLAARARRQLQRLPFALAWLVLELLPIALFAAAGTILAGFLVTNPSARLTTLALVNAYAVSRAVICVGRALLAPKQPGLRLLPVGEPAAAYLLRWLRVVAVVAVFGNALAEIISLLSGDAGAHDTLVRLTGLIVALLLMAIAVETRHAVAGRLRSRADVPQALPHLRNALAVSWPYLAILLIAFGWLAWAAGLGGSGTGRHLLVLTVVVLVAARLVAIVGLGGLDRLFRRFAGGDDRTVRYNRPLRRAIHSLIAVAAAVALLQLWGPVGGHLLSVLITIAVAVVAAMIVWEAVNAAIDLRLGRLDAEEQTSARLRTLLPILRTSLLTTILIIVGLTVLSEIGVNIAPLLAGAGIAGVAIGFGSQKLVQDVITGMFVLFENAIRLGDTVTVAGLSGTVEQLSVRNLWLRAADGAVHVVPFSAVSTITNSNRGVGNAVVSVTVAFKEDTDRVAATLEEIGSELRSDPNYARMTVSDFQLWGVDAVKASGVTITGQIVCTDAGRMPVQREFNRRLKQRFDALGIELAG